MRETLLVTHLESTSMQDYTIRKPTRSHVCLYDDQEFLPGPPYTSYINITMIFLAMGTELFVAGRGKTFDADEKGFREARVELTTFTFCNSQVLLKLVENMFNKNSGRLQRCCKSENNVLRRS